jgi:hypothetical protein
LRFNVASHTSFRQTKTDFSVKEQSSEKHLSFVPGSMVQVAGTIVGDPHSNQSSCRSVILSERSESKDPQLLFVTSHRRSSDRIQPLLHAVILSAAKDRRLSL